MPNILSTFITNLILLKQDFIGITFSLQSFVNFFFSILFVFVYIVFLFFFGEKIIKLLKYSSQALQDSLIKIALGHIFFSTGIFILGLFSILTPTIISCYTIIVLIFSFIPLEMKNFIDTKKQWGMLFQKMWKENRLLTITLLLFLTVGFLRLLVPEINSDATYYHHDYPQEYIRIHSLMEKPEGILLYLTTPQLGQMIYIITQLLQLENASRVIHFTFYILTFLALLVVSSVINKKQAVLYYIFPALFFASSFTVVHLMSSGYVDAQCLFCWILSLSILVKKQLSKKDIFISAILFSGALASKIQVLPLLPAIITYILIATKKQKIQFASLFFFIALIFPSLWYLRSFILTGSLFFPAAEGLSITSLISQLFSLSTIKSKALGLIINYNPFVIFSFLTVIVFILIKRIKSSNYLVLAVLLFANYLFLPILYFFGRFLLFLFSILSLTARDLPKAFTKNKLFFLAICFFSFLLLAYYFISTALILPYGLGWADTNAYLTRVLVVDGLSYYDFNHLFSSHISKRDTVGVDILGRAEGFGFLYANFIPHDVHFFISPRDSFTKLEKENITKLVLKAEDVETFCKVWRLTECTKDHYQLIASYDPAQQYLYELK